MGPINDNIAHWHCQSIGKIRKNLVSSFSFSLFSNRNYKYNKTGTMKVDEKKVFFRFDDVCIEMSSQVSFRTRFFRSLYPKLIMFFFLSKLCNTECFNMVLCVCFFVYSKGSLFLSTSLTIEFREYLTNIILIKIQKRTEMGTWKVFQIQFATTMEEKMEYSFFLMKSVFHKRMQESI